MMTAVYRMTQDRWSAARAFEEMKHYKFGPDLLHREFKHFLLGYDADLVRQATTQAESIENWRRLNASRARRSFMEANDSRPTGSGREG